MLRLLYILYKSYLLGTIYGKELGRFYVNLKKIVEFVEKVLYNEDKLNEKYRKQWKSACIEYTKML